MTIAPPYELHLFSCVNDFACIHDGPAVEIRTFFKRKIKEGGLGHRMRANQSGCLNQCGHGPMLVVYPQGVWYSHLSLADAQLIWDEHVVGGRPVEKLRYVPVRPGKNKMPRTLEPGTGLTVVDTKHPDFEPCQRCPQAR